MRRAWSILLCALACAACGASPAPESAPPPARTAPPPAIEPLAIAPIAIAADGSSEPMLVLGADGAIAHADCPGRIEGDAIRGTIDLRLDAHGDLTVRDGAPASLRIDGERLVRPEGRAISIDDDRVVLEGSPALALRVEGASSPSLRRTALVLVAYLTLCAE